MTRVHAREWSGCLTSYGAKTMKPVLDRAGVPANLRGVLTIPEMSTRVKAFSPVTPPAAVHSHVWPRCVVLPPSQRRGGIIAREASPWARR